MIQNRQPPTRTGRFQTAIVIVLFWMSPYVYVPILPVHVSARSFSSGAIGVVLASYGLAQFLLRIPTGLASDRMGQRKWFVVLGLVASLVSATGLAIAPEAFFLGFSRFVGGMAASSWVVLTVLFSGFSGLKKRCGQPAWRHS